FPGIVRCRWFPPHAVASAAAWIRSDEHERISRTQRNRRGGEPPDCRRCSVLGDPGAELFAFFERYDAVAGPGLLPDAEEFLRPQLCADRRDHIDHAADLLAAAAGGRTVLRSQAAALFVSRRNGGDPGRSSVAG